MKNQYLYRRLLSLSLFLVLLTGIQGSAWAKSTSIQEQPLDEVLEELGEWYQVFFSYEPRLVKEIYVDFAIRPEE